MKLRGVGLLLVGALSTSLGWSAAGGETAPAPPAHLQITVAFPGQEPPGPGQLTLSSSDATAPRVLEWKGEPLTVELPAGSSWQLAAEFAGRWCDLQPLVVGPAGSTQQVVATLWPAGQVQGALKLPGGAPSLPRLVQATLEASPLERSARKMTRGSVGCPVDDDGKFSCWLPAKTPIDVAFRVEGYVPQYRWGLELAAEKPTDLGALLLVEGASVAGWMTISGGDLDPKAAKVRLLPMQAPQGESRTALRLQAAAFEARVRSDGFFQTDRVPGGKYTLEVTHPGYAAARILPVEVFPGRESALRELVILQRPLTLSLTLEPALDWLEKPWRVSIERTAELSGAREPGVTFNGAAPLSGHLEVPNVAPGMYFLKVTDSLDNAFHFEFQRPVRDATEAQISLRLEVVRVEGTLLLGGEPLAGSVFFGTRFGGLKSAMEANSEGHFEGVLPKAGRWNVEVIVSDLAIEAITRVDVEAGKPVLVELPDTHLHGVVVDEQENPAPGAQIFITTGSERIRPPTADREGKFEARAVPVGRVQLMAQRGTPTGRLSSDPYRGEIQEDAPLGPVRLILQEHKRCEGRVVSSLGPVAGAAVVGITTSSNPSGDQAMTDMEGRFTLEAHHSAAAVQVIVQPPGYGLEAFEIACDSTSAELSVSELQGTIVIRVPGDAADPEGAAQVLQLFQDGMVLPVGLLANWAMGHGIPLSEGGWNGLTVPALAPGSYQLCLGPAQAIQMGEIDSLEWATSQARCTKGTLAPGDTLTLESPTLPWKKK